MRDLILRPMRQLLSILDPTGQESPKIEEMLAQFQISNTQTAMEATRVTDLTTGLPYAGEITSTLTAVMEVPGGDRAEMKVVEGRRYAYRYEP